MAYRVDMLEKGVIQVLGKMEWDSTRSLYATQNGTQFKAYELFLNFTVSILGLQLTLDK